MAVCVEAARKASEHSGVAVGWEKREEANGGPGEGAAAEDVLTQRNRSTSVELSLSSARASAALSASDHRLLLNQLEHQTTQTPSLRQKHSYGSGEAAA